MQQHRKYVLIPLFGLVLGTESCCEVDDLSLGVMFDKCMRLAMNFVYVIYGSGGGALW